MDHFCYNFMFVFVMLFVAALLPSAGKKLTSLRSYIERFLVFCHLTPGVPGHVVLDCMHS